MDQPGQVADLLAIGIEHEVVEGAADELGRLKSEEAARRFGCVEDDSAVRSPRDHVGRVLGHQAIARLALAQRLLRHAALGDIVVHADRSDDIAGAVDHGSAADLDPDDRSIFAPDAHLVLIGHVAQTKPRLLPHQRDVFGICEQQVALQSSKLFAAVADHLAEAVVDELEHAVVAGLHQPFAHPLDKKAVALLALPQRVLGELAIGDVDDRPLEDLGRAVQHMNAFDEPAGAAVLLSK